MPPETKLYIADCDLKALPVDHVGHSFSYYSAFAAAPDPVTYLCHQSFSSRNTSIQRVFRLSRGKILAARMLPKFPRFDGLLKTVWANSSYLRSLFRAKIRYPAVILHINSTEFNIIAVHIFGIISRNCYQIAYLQTEPGRMQAAIWSGLGFLAGGRILAACETVNQSVQYATKIGRTVHLLPSAVNPRIFRKQITKIGYFGDRPLRGCFLGDARHEKGYDLISRWLVQAPDSFTFDIQIRSDLNAINKIENPLSLEMWKAAALSNGKINLLFGPLQESEYIRTLHRVDFILIPYRRESYSKRSSGIFFEALAAGLPVLITSGLAVQAEAEHSGAAVYFDDGVEDSFHNALREMKLRYNELKRNAERAAAYLETTHTPRAILNRLAETRVCSENRGNAPS